MKKLLTLSEIKTKVVPLAAKIDAPKDTLPTFGRSEQTGRPHIEVDSSGYHYVVAERGHELERHTTFDIDECLYWTFIDITWTLSIRYELAHRIKTKDGRRLMFPYQLGLLSMLSPQWSERQSQEHERRLRENPLDDYASVRVDFIGELRNQGYSQEQAREMAYDKYPSPKSS
jgi:hypothetical protein